MTRHSSLPSAAFTRQRGSIAVLMALGIGVLVLMLSVIDIGFMYTTKREYQKAADLAAMAGAQALIDEDGVRSCSSATDAATTNVETNLRSPAIDQNYTPEVTCGEWNTRAADGPFLTGFDDDSSSLNAVRAIVRGRPFGFFIPALFGRDPPEIWAEGIATRNATQAQLKIRSTVATLDDGAVNALMSSLLGGHAALGVVGWQGVANADVSILDLFNNILDIDVIAGIGTYHDLLDTTVSMSEVLNATIQAAGPSSAAGLVLSSFEEQLGLVGINANSLSVPLGDIVSLQAGAESAGLDSAINALELIRSVVEIANMENAIAATIPISIPGVAGVSVRASVVEKPQSSAIGNPALIGDNPETGPNRIYVRTAQVRTLVSVDLHAVGLVDDLLSILGPLGGVVQIMDSQLHIAMGLASAEGWVTDHSCNIDGNKTLFAESKTSIANVSVGKLTNTQQDAVFTPDTPFPTAGPLNILSIRLSVPLIGTADVVRVTLSEANAPIGASLRDFTYSATSATPDGLPGIYAADTEARYPLGMYQQLSAQNPLASLNNTVSGLNLELEVLPGSLVGTILSILGVTSLINNTLAPAVSALVGSLLSPLLDPLLNDLFGALGLNLADAELGAKMSCTGGGATLAN